MHMHDHKFHATPTCTIQIAGGKSAGTSMATLSILDIGPVIFGTAENLVSYLQQSDLCELHHAHGSWKEG